MNVLTNGCFDILHAGHVALLEGARQYGDRLIVALNSDRSVRELKGSSRPINDQDARRQVLEAIRYVDEVRIFDSEAELAELVRELRPVLVKGTDYEGKRITGSEYAARVVLLPIVPGYSTTATINKL